MTDGEKSTLDAADESVSKEFLCIEKKYLIAHLYATILEVRVFLKGDINGECTSKNN